MPITLTQKIQSQIQLFTSLTGNRNFWIIIGTDIVLIILAHYLAIMVRFADTLSGMELFAETYPSLQILLVLITIPVYYATGLYRGMWRYTSYNDVLDIFKGTLYAAAIIMTILLFANRFAGYSRSVFILDTLFIFLLITAHRVAIRFFYTRSQNSRKLATEPQPREKKKLLLIGAGSSAEKVLREIRENPRLPYDVVGMVDDDPDKTGRKIHGIPVVGMINDLSDHIRRTDAREILIAISSISGPAMQHLVNLCQETGIPYKALPGISEIINGKVSLKTMRDISYADLLGREEVKVEQEKIGDYLTGKIILVTGAGGSIGSELCRQILRFSPGKIILFDAGEENLYSIQMDLINEHKFSNAIPILGKVQDQGLLDLVFQKYNPAVVFHAAAYKHVPLVENNPWQAIHTNVFGTQLLLETSIIHGVDRFVLVSTDKAVRPTNVMGASKRLTELLMLAYGNGNWDGSFSPARSSFHKQSSRISKTGKPSHKTIFMAVRFGNVLGSSGSVIPLFKRQIELGGPVTVTHPEITRYFMSIEEAAQLILQAGAMGHGREIFILEMGEPIKIAQMARDLIKLAGKEPDTEIEITYTGLREGEKLYEELITEGEGIVETDHEKIMVLRGKSQTCSELFPGLEQLQQQALAHDARSIKKALHDLIPEYTPDYQTKSGKNTNSIPRAA